MIQQNRFFIIPVLVSVLAVVAMFNSPASDAGEGHLKTSAELCPHAGLRQSQSVDNDAYQRWLWLHVHGMTKSQPGHAIERLQPMPSDNGLLRVSNDLSPSPESHARTHSF
jgi:hypothetical protein